jgi:hypothetical protein
VAEVKIRTLCGEMSTYVPPQPARGRFRAFCDQHLPHAEECMATYIESPEFDAHLVTTIRRAFPPHEHEQFVAHYWGLLGAWVNDQRAAAATEISESG